MSTGYVMDSHLCCGSGSLVNAAKSPGTLSGNSSTYDDFDSSVAVSLGLGHISIKKKFNVKQEHTVFKNCVFVKETK